MINNNFRANQRYKLLRSEQERKAKVFDRDMTSLMGYILGISCSLDQNNKQPETELKKCRPSTSGGVPRAGNKNFVRYANRRDFLKNEAKMKRNGRTCNSPGSSHGNECKSHGNECKSKTCKISSPHAKERAKEIKHVRFKPEPQVHIIERTDHSATNLILERPNSAPALVRYSSTTQPAPHNPAQPAPSFKYDTSWRRWHLTSGALNDEWFPKPRLGWEANSGPARGSWEANSARLGWEAGSSVSRPSGHVTSRIGWDVKSSAMRTGTYTVKLSAGEKMGHGIGHRLG